MTLREVIIFGAFFNVLNEVVHASRNITYTRI